MKLILKRLPKIRLKVPTALNMMILHKKYRLTPSKAEKFLPKAHGGVFPKDLVCRCTICGGTIGQTTADKGNAVKKALFQALSFMWIARDAYVKKHSEDFDIDWAMEQFSAAEEILERLKEAEGNE